MRQQGDWYTNGMIGACSQFQVTSDIYSMHLWYLAGVWHIVFTCLTIVLALSVYLGRATVVFRLSLYKDVTGASSELAMPKISLLRGSCCAFIGDFSCKDPVNLWSDYPPIPIPPRSRGFPDRWLGQGVVIGGDCFEGFEHEDQYKLRIVKTDDLTTKNFPIFSEYLEIMVDLSVIDSTRICSDASWCIEQSCLRWLLLLSSEVWPESCHVSSQSVVKQ